MADDRQYQSYLAIERKPKKGKATKATTKEDPSKPAAKVRGNRGENEATSEAMANAAGMTPGEYGAAYPGQAGPEAMQSNNPVMGKIGQSDKFGPIDPADPAGGGTYTGPKPSHDPATGKPAAAGAGAPSAAEALMNSLVGQYQAAMAQVNPYISGQVGSQAVQTATSQAAGAGGPTGPAPSTEAGGLAMIANDASAYEKANAAGAAGVAQALKDTGTANALALKVDPYMGILQALTSEAQYKTETGAPPASITGTKMPPWLEAAFQATTGSAPGGASPVGTPVTGTTPPPISASTPSTNTPSSPYGA